MAFRCTACSDKSYDKDWKLQRHIRESTKCFETINPGKSANQLARFRCTRCDYSSPRGLDLKRHRQRIHGETVNTTASDQLSSRSTDASREGSTQEDTTVITDTLLPARPHERQGQLPLSDVKLDRPYIDEILVSDPSATSVTFAALDPTTCLQSATLLRPTEEPCQTPSRSLLWGPVLQNLTAKRSNAGLDLPCTNRKRVCTGTNLPVSSVDEVPDDRAEDVTFNHAIDELSLTPGPDWCNGLNGESHVGVLSQSHSSDPSIADSLSSMALKTVVDNHETQEVTKACARSPISTNENQTTILLKSNTSNARKMLGIDMSASNAHRQSYSSPMLGTTPSTSSISMSSHSTSHQRSLHSPDVCAMMLKNVDDELSSSLDKNWRSKQAGSSEEMTPEDREILRILFRDAARHNDKHQLHSLVHKFKIELNDRDSEGRTALAWAVERGYHPAIEALLLHASDYIDVNSRDDRGMTALMFACRNVDVHVVHSLLSLPTIDPNAQDNRGMTALVYACQVGDLGVVESLLSFSTIDLSVGSSALVTAIRFWPTHEYDIFQKLVAHVQTRPDYHTTAAKWHPLLNARDEEDARGLTPLHWAVEMDLSRCASTLLDTGRIDVDRKARRGITAAMQAVEDVSGSLVGTLLVRKACDPTVTNDRGETLLVVARRVAQEKERERTWPNVGEYESQLARRNLRLCEAYYKSWRVRAYPGKYSSEKEDHVFPEPVFHNS